VTPNLGGESTGGELAETFDVDGFANLSEDPVRLIEGSTAERETLISNGRSGTYRQVWIGPGMLGLGG
jgi:hypothetical protein